MKRGRHPQRLEGTHRRVEFEDDYDRVHSRTSGIDQRGHTSSSESKPLRGKAGWTLGSMWNPPDDSELSLNVDGSGYEDQMNAEVFESTIFHDTMEPQKATRSKVLVSGKSLETSLRAEDGWKRRPHLVWKEQFRSVYLDKVTRHDGRGDAHQSLKCPDCIARNVEEEVQGEPEVRCKDCFLSDLVCTSCCIHRHRQNPFHRIERWTGLYFAPIMLKAIGLRVQLNHQSFRCPLPIPCHVKLRILHTTGIHDVAVDYCGCGQKVVKTCATFRLLELLHLFSLVSKTSTYHFYRTLERMTDNTGLNTPPSRKAALMRMLIQWRHLKLLKRGGRVHDVTGPEGTKPGELAVLCPSCPRPGINLPPDWDQAPPHLKFLYILLICIDANFRLKNQIVSSYSRDPGLGIGWAYFTAREPYEEYVQSRATDADISNCVEFSAVAKSNTKFSKGLHYTGVVAVSCGRSEMVLPTCVGNTNKGERYANVDPLAAAAIRQFSDLLWVIISYDIACQWIKTIFTWMTSHWPSELRFNPDIRVTPLVPKFHEPGHKAEDHEQFSFNLAEGAALSDGECPERIWAPHNVLGNSTKTAGPGTRQDLIDDHFGFWNWLKYCCMGLTLWKRYRDAVSERNRQEEAHRGFMQSLPPNMVAEWEDICAAWEADEVPKMVLNPFCVQSDDLTEDEVHKELAEEEEARRRNGGQVVHDMSPSAFMVFGLALEESQRKLCLETAHIAEQRSLLRSKIKKFEELRATYMPGLLQFITETQEVDYSSTGALAEEVRLWLPSCIPGGSQEPGSIRHILRLKMRMVKYKNKNVRGQRDGTRSRTGIDAIHEWALAAAIKYRMAREAKMKLSGPGDWEEGLHKLEDGDIRSYQDPDRLHKGTGRRGTNEDSWEPGLVPELPEPGVDLYQDSREKRDGTGQTWRTLSWIWTTTKINLADGADENDDEVLRSEWCRSRARAHRAREEVLLLREEMCRTLRFLEWRGEWWMQRQDARELGGALCEAVDAYALKQSDIQRQLAVKFWDLWLTALDDGRMENAPRSELHPSDDDDASSGGDRDEQNIGIWSDEEEVELDEEDYAGSLREQ
ncbi:uncharacterized protein EV420DRAFT_1642357 [Desarmillaria tabescens]|uniref:CxC2-like cysteine cluster KDZ transposase-associated domain-containing protein n=1 Tax=Armillaria tabescens TaxID=1929756 RepID=A0AA39KDW7_ARMTA|nr:uncharacterized protein EV420DRAFT_1642357 [Desarmillaria tabescens]KAK0459382.1 hypothetical protein EV420DRAFT_1642357 [Desarmillaria tabescens]